MRKLQGWMKSTFHITFLANYESRLPSASDPAGARALILKASRSLAGLSARSLSSFPPLVMVLKLPLTSRDDIEAIDPSEVPELVETEDLQAYLFLAVAVALVYDSST